MHWIEIGSRLAVLATLISVNASPTLAAPVSNVTIYTFGSIRDCGTNCMLDVLHPLCDDSGHGCTCKDNNLLSAVQACLDNNCHFSIIESLKIIKQSQTMCKLPIQVRIKHLRAISATMSFIVLLAAGLRFYARWEQRTFHGDDILMVFVIVSMIPYTASAMLQQEIGQNMWDLEPTRIVFGLKIFVIFQAFYCLVIALSKLSILLFYIRVFPSRIFKITSMVLFVFILLTYFIILVLGFLRCLPLNVTWLAWKGDWKGGEVRCKDPYDVILGLGVLNTAQEFLVLILPLPHVFRLKIRWKKKAGLVALFSLGILTCIISIIRIPKIKHFNRSTNPTWDYANIYLWSGLEVYMNAIVPNLLGVFTLLSMKFPRFFGHADEQAKVERHKENSFFRRRRMGYAGNAVGAEGVSGMGSTGV